MALRPYLALAAALSSMQAATADEATGFALDVSRHVLVHEVAHALLREFALPVLGNEEEMADTFATVTISQEWRDAAARIVSARARSWLIEASERSFDEGDLKGEHDLDARRAYRAVCLLQGADPSEWAGVAAGFGIDAADAADCSDTMPDMIAGWSAVLAPHRLPVRASSAKVLVRYGDAEHTGVVRAAGLLEEVAQLMRAFDWPEPVVLHYDSCGREGASWSRSERRILFCDEYFGRFLRQAAAAGHAPP